MGDTLQDRVARGLGTVARVVGQPADAFRPARPTRPLASENRFLRLPAAFHVGTRFTTPERHGAPLWQGLFDSAYTRPGDYLAQGDAVYFIASQPRLLPVLCVKTNRVVRLSRGPITDRVGEVPYGGFDARELFLLTEWPASMFGLRGAGLPRAHLPADVGRADWTVLLPASVPVAIQANDRLHDDLGREGIVAGVEESDLGWRLFVQEARV